MSMLSLVVTVNKNRNNVVTSRTRLDYHYTGTGIRSVSLEYLVDSTNHTDYAQTIVETTKSRDAIKEADIRPIAKTLGWNKQLQMWNRLRQGTIGLPRKSIS